MIYKLPNIKSFISRPKVFYKNIQISESTSETIYDLLPENFYSGLNEIYPDATLLDLFQWVEFLGTKSISIDKDQLSNAYSFFWNETAEKLYRMSPDWPKDFKLWCKLKKAHVNDLRPMCLLERLQPDQQTKAYDFINHFEKLKLSLSDGKKILELYLDVLGSNIDLELIDLNLTSEQIIKKLTKLRYPLSTKKDERKKAFVKNTKWPNNARVNFLRQGDQTGFEFSVFINQPDQKVKYLKMFEEGLDKVEIYFKNTNTRDH